MYTHPAAFGSAGHPLSRSVTRPETVGTSAASVHACHCPGIRLPLDDTSRTAPRPATGAP